MKSVAKVLPDEIIHGASKLFVLGLKHLCPSQLGFARPACSAELRRAHSTRLQRLGVNLCPLGVQNLKTLPGFAQVHGSLRLKLKVWANRS